MSQIAESPESSDPAPSMVVSTPSPKGAADSGPTPFPIVMSLVSVGVLVLAVIAERAGASPSAAASPTASAEVPAPAPAEAPAPPSPPTAPVADLKAIQGEIDGLGQRIEQLQKQLETQLAALPKPSPSPDLKPLLAKVESLDKLPDQVAPLPKKLGELDNRMGSLDKGLLALQSEVASLREQIKNRPEPASAARPDEAAASVPDVAPALALGAGLLQQRRFADALIAFQELQRTHPEDARVWYYSALASGFVTKNWGAGEAVRLVDKGVEREKAGTPASSLIDAAFASLSKADGKEWLDYYRQRARK